MTINLKPDSGIALLRAEYTFPFIGLLRAAGAPVDSELQRARLPALIEELPDAFVSTDLIFRFIEQASRRVGIDNIGFDAGWKLRYEDLGPALTSAINQAPNLRVAIETFSRLVLQEDSEYRCYLEDRGEQTRICVQQYIPAGADTRIAEWQNIKAVIEVIRQYQQPGWLPRAVGLLSRQTPKSAERDRLGDIKVLTGQPDTFIEIPTTLLEQPRPLSGEHFPQRPNHGAICSCTSDLSRYENDLPSRLRSALIPYLASGNPGIELAAKIAGTSVRKLQRILDQRQTSYSELLETLRYEQALHLLRHTDLKILDIALSLGYSDASNFARTVRRISGSSPRELRSNG